MSLARQLRYLRKKANLTQQQVADVLGINRSTYAYYETGKTSPKLQTLQALARIYNTNVDILLESGRSDNSVLNSPDRFEKWYSNDKFNQLSDFEKAVLLRVRILSLDERRELIRFLDSFIQNEDTER